MRTFDFTPFARHAIGFEALFDQLSDRAHDNNEGYPPYDIVRRGNDEFQIHIAVAGFSPNEITITAEANQLTVAGRKQDKPGVEYLYQGIASRSFERRFNLADYVEVKRASFEDGLLQIELEREVPESMKPRKIEVQLGRAQLSGDKTKTIEHSKVA